MSLGAKFSVFISLPWTILLNILIINYPFNYSVEPFNKIAQGRVMNTKQNYLESKKFLTELGLDNINKFQYNNSIQ